MKEDLRLKRRKNIIFAVGVDSIDGGLFNNCCFSLYYERIRSKNER